MDFRVGISYVSFLGGKKKEKKGKKEKKKEKKEKEKREKGSWYQKRER